MEVDVHEPARRPLIALSVFTSIATVTGTFMYTYPETMRPIRDEMILVHDVSGDLMLVSALVYLWRHLAKTWRMKKRQVSKWTGYVTVTSLTVLGVTGVWGQVDVLTAGSALHLAHLVCAVAIIAIGCFHGVYGLRRRLR